MECPLNVGEGWSATRTKAMELIQTGHHLINGKLNLAAELKTNDIPMCRVDDLATVSMSHLDVYGDGGRGAFDMAEGCSDTDAYPCLWQVNSPVSGQWRHFLTSRSTAARGRGKAATIARSQQPSTLQCQYEI